jgi:AraC-like DNA-binding protein
MLAAHGLTIEGMAWQRPAPLLPIKGVQERGLALGAVRLEQIASGGARQFDESAHCRFLFQLRGRATLAAPDQSIGLPSRHWCPVGAGAFGIHPCEEAELYLLSLPLDHLSRRLVSQIRARRWAVQPIENAAQMCVELARSSLEHGAQINASVEMVLGESLAELAKLAVIEQLCVKRVETVRETVRARIEAFIQRNLVDPDLSIDRIAERLQCTKRYLHKVFSDEGQTLSQYIWAQRLERCRADLGRADLADKSITEIAFGWGFSNAAHFSRSFRARFGQPPRAYRRTVTTV